MPRACGAGYECILPTVRLVNPKKGRPSRCAGREWAVSSASASPEDRESTITFSTPKGCQSIAGVRQPLVSGPSRFSWNPTPKPRGGDSQYCRRFAAQDCERRLRACESPTATETTLATLRVRCTSGLGSRSAFGENAFAMEPNRKQGTAVCSPRRSPRASDCHKCGCEIDLAPCRDLVRGVACAKLPSE